MTVEQNVANAWDNLMDTVIRVYGFEARPTIRFCKLVEEGKFMEASILYKKLIKK